jgi:hypothetical protein
VGIVRVRSASDRTVRAGKQLVVSLCLGSDAHARARVSQAGMWTLAHNLSDASVFTLLYAVTSIYFSGVMVRLMLVLTPIMVVLAGVGMSALVESWYVCAMRVRAPRTTRARTGCRT